MDIPDILDRLRGKRESVVDAVQLLEGCGTSGVLRLLIHDCCEAPTLGAVFPGLL